MNNKALTLSLLAAAFAVLFMHSYVTSIENETKSRFGTEVLVITAKKDMKEMETLTEAALDMKTIPKTFLEPAAIFFEQTEQDQNTDKERKKLSGSIAVVPIRKGEQITFNKLTDPSMKTGLAPQITPGKRAFTIPITEISGVAKLVKPGDRVDLIAMLVTGQTREQKIVKTVAQDIVILAVGKYITNNVARSVELDPVSGKSRVKALAEFDGFTSVTVEVEPKDVQALALLTMTGDHQLALSLRNNDDADIVRLGPSSIMEVYGPEWAKGAQSGQQARGIAGGK